MRLTEYVKSLDGKGLEAALRYNAWSDDELNEALLVSARLGSVTCYRHLARSGATSLATNYSGKNAMQLALQNGGTLPLVQAILFHTEDLVELLDHIDSFQMTALSYAAYHGNTKALNEIVKISRGLKGDKLLGECLEWESERPRGTPLMLAAKQGHQSAVEYLISVGANVNRSNRDRTTALMYASQKGHLECVKLLLQHGARERINDGDGWGTNALLFAVQGEHEDITKLLIQNGANVNAMDRAGSSPLMWAISRGNEDIVDLLVKSGADINCVNDDGLSPFLMAVKRDQVEIAQKLTRLGADVTQKFRRHQTAIHLAAVKNKNRCLAYLLGSDFPHQYDVNALDKDGKTPLTLACERTYLSNVEILLQHGADPDLRDNNGAGLSPLACALRVSVLYPVEGTGVTRALLYHGCNVNQKEMDHHYAQNSHSRNLPLELALKAGQLALAKMLWLAGSERGDTASWTKDNIPWNCFIHTHPLYPFSDQFRQEISTFLREVVNQPRSLSECCSREIRHCLGRDIPCKVGQLGLPETIEELVTLKTQLEDIERINQEKLKDQDYLESDGEILTDMTETSEDEEIIEQYSNNCMATLGASDSDDSEEETIAG